MPEVVTAAPKLTAMQRLFRSDRRHRFATAVPNLAPDHRLRPLALCLSGCEADPELAVLALRENLAEFLVPSFGDDPRSPTVVLRSGWATDEERELVLAALAASLHIESGVASAGGALVALVRVGECWRLAGPPPEGVGRIEPVHPPTLPPSLEVVRARSASAAAPVRPMCEWIGEFAPGS